MALDYGRVLDGVGSTARRTDWTMVLAACALVAIGITFIWSASSRPDETGWFPLTGLALKQALWAVVALAAMAVVLVTPYRFFARFGYTFYFLAMAGLLYVLVLGPEINYARRWIALGPPGRHFLTVQPSEFAKVAFVIALAKFLRYRESYRRWWGLLVPFGMAALPMVLIAAEPDLGSALVFGPVVFVLLYVAGARKRHLLLYAAAPVAVALVFWLLGVKVLKPYQSDRLLALLDPEGHAGGAGYHLLQSLAAVCSGGLWGKGLGQGTQGQLGFLPARRTDSIFASIAEEWGFVGATVVLALYAYLLFSAMAVARQTRDPFGRLLAVGVMTLLATQALINTGMTVRLAPVTGLPLPFVSLGGSSLVANFIALGILLNVGARPTLVLSREDFQ